MVIAVSILLIIIVGMLAAVLAVLLQDRTPAGQASVLPAPGLDRGVATGVDVTDEPVVEVVRSSDGGFQVLDRISGQALVDLRPISMPTNRSGSRSSIVPANAMFLAGLSGIGIDVAKGLTAGTEYVVRFTPEIQKMLDSGSAVLMRTSRGQVSDAVSRLTGQVLEHGTVAETSVQDPVRLLGGGLTTAAAAAQLYQIQQALKRIEERLDELVIRVRDDDHGELSAAEELVAPLLAAVINGQVPPQLASELAVHRQRVESIYFSRQRFVERFRDELEDRQDRHAEKKGESRAWARGAVKAFGDREAFEAEVLIYARAMSIRARLALCTAAVVSLDGQPDVAQWMLRDIGENTLDAFGDLARRLSALGREDPGWTWIPMSGRKELQETAQALADLFETQVAPQLPARPSDTVEFHMQIGTGSSPDAW